MAKIIIPQKVAISYDEEGALGTITIQYKTRIDGKLSQNISSLSVKASVDNGKATDILSAALTAANTAEGVE